MSPPPLSIWEEVYQDAEQDEAEEVDDREDENDDGDYAEDEEDNDGYDEADPYGAEELQEDDYGSDSELSYGNESDDLPPPGGYTTWPDLFDQGTEASSRSRSPTSSRRSSNAPASPILEPSRPSEYWMQPLPACLLQGIYARFGLPSNGGGNSSSAGIGADTVGVATPSEAYTPLTTAAAATASDGAAAQSQTRAARAEAATQGQSNAARAEIDEDEDEAGFFISAGAVGAVPVDQLEFDGANCQLEPSAPLREYLEATGGLVVGKSSEVRTSSLAAERDAAATRLQRATRARQRRQRRPLGQASPAPEELEGGEELVTRLAPVSPGTQAAEVETVVEEECFVSADVTLVAAAATTDTTKDQGTFGTSKEYLSKDEEATLRAQLLAKQVLMPIVLQAVFRVQAMTAKDVETQMASQETVQKALSPSLSLPPADIAKEAPRSQSGNCGEPEGEASPEQASRAVLSPRLEAPGVDTEAAQLSRDAHCHRLEEESFASAAAEEEPAGSFGKAAAFCGVGVSAVASKPAASRIASSSGQPTASLVRLSPGTAPRPGRRLVCASRGRRGGQPGGASRPRQPPPRPEKRPPVPRAPRGDRRAPGASAGGAGDRGCGVAEFRSASKESLHSSRSGADRALQQASSSSCSSESSTTPAAPSVSPAPDARMAGGINAGARPQAGAATKVVDRAPGAESESAEPADVACAAGRDSAEAPCYEVSEEEFNRLLSAGAFKDMPADEGEEEAEGLACEYYEISEEEFERLLQAGSLHPAPVETSTPLEASPSSSGGGASVPADEALYEVSEAQFERLAHLGLLRQDVLEEQRAHGEQLDNLTPPILAPSHPPSSAGSCASDRGCSERASDWPGKNRCHSFSAAAGSPLNSARFLRELRAQESSAVSSDWDGAEALRSVSLPASRPPRALIGQPPPPDGDGSPPRVLVAPFPTRRRQIGMPRVSAGGKLPHLGQAGGGAGARGGGAPCGGKGPSSSLSIA